VTSISSHTETAFRSRDGSPVVVHHESRRVTLGGVLLGLLTWIVILIFFFPVAWMALTGFKQEKDAATTPPRFLFPPTLSQYSDALSKGVPFLENSILITVTSTVVVLMLALPAAYALSIAPVRKWRDALFFFISTKMLPVAGAIIPLYLIAKNLHVLDHRVTLVVLYTSLNLPIAVWMLRSFLLEIPVEILEAARVDGASLLRQLRSVVLPLISPGLAATALICFIFAWNEFFLAVNLTTTEAATVPVYLVSFQTGEGQFWAHLCAGATLACLPVLIAGWAAQDKLVRGLSMGAVK
jgi:sorbitol/mannitol transport system permease protein